MFCKGTHWSDKCEENLLQEKNFKNLIKDAFCVSSKVTWVEIVQRNTHVTNENLFIILLQVTIEKIYQSTNLLNNKKMLVVSLNDCK